MCRGNRARSNFFNSPASSAVSGPKASGISFSSCVWVCATVVSPNLLYAAKLAHPKLPAQSSPPPRFLFALIGPPRDPSFRAESAERGISLALQHFFSRSSMSKGAPSTMFLPGSWFSGPVRSTPLPHQFAEGAPGTDSVPESWVSGFWFCHPDWSNGAICRCAVEGSLHTRPVLALRSFLDFRVSLFELFSS